MGVYGRPILVSRLWPKRRANTGRKNVPGGKQIYLKRGHRAFFLKEAKLLKLIEIVVEQAGEKRTVPAVSLPSRVGGW